MKKKYSYYITKQAKVLTKIIKADKNIPENVKEKLIPYQKGKVIINRLNTIKSDLKTLKVKTSKTSNKYLKPPKLSEINKYDIDKKSNLLIFKKSKNEIIEKYDIRSRDYNRAIISDVLNPKQPLITKGYTRLLQSDKDAIESIKRVEQQWKNRDKEKNPLFFKMTKGKDKGKYRMNKTRYYKNVLSLKEVIKNAAKRDSLKKRLEEQGLDYVDLDETGFQIFEKGKLLYEL